MFCERGRTPLLRFVGDEGERILHHGQKMHDCFRQFTYSGVPLLAQKTTICEAAENHLVRQREFLQAVLERLCVIDDRPNPLLNGRWSRTRDGLVMRVIDCELITICVHEFWAGITPKNSRDFVSLLPTKSCRRDADPYERDIVRSSLCDFSWHHHPLFERQATGQFCAGERSAYPLTFAAVLASLWEVLFGHVPR